MFGKSKRFEDKPVGCGADAAYDPKDSVKPIGGVIPTVDRFIELKSPSSVKSDTESVQSEKSSQVFRTPKAVRRFPITPSKKVVDKPGLRNRSQSTDSFMKELLEAKCVELRHKDATIAEYSTQIKQMKKQLKSLEDDVVHFRQLSLVQDTSNHSEVDTTSSSPCRHANCSATEEIAQLTNEIGILKTSNETLKNQIESLINNKDIELLKYRLSELNQENEAVKSLLSEFNAGIDKENWDEQTIDSKLSDLLRAFIDDYRFEVNTTITLQAALSNAEKEITNLKHANIEQFEQLLGEKTLKEKIAHLESHVAELNDYDEKRSMDILGMSDIINTKDTLCNDLLEQLSDSSAQITELKENIALVKGHHSLALEANESIRHEYKMETDALKVKHEEELASLNQHYKNEIENGRQQYFKEFDKSQSECSDRIKSIEDNFNAQFRQLEENSNEKLRICEIQFEERYQDLQNYAESRIAQEKEMWRSNLEECQKIAENEVMSSELQIIKLKSLLDISDKKNEAFEENISQITASINQLKSELQSNKEENIKCENEIDNLKKEVERVNNEKKRFSLTLETTRQTIDVLGTRLRNSDEDVEQLKLALEESAEASLVMESKLKNAELAVQKHQAEYNEVLLQIIQSKAALDQSHNNILDKNSQLFDSIAEMETEFTSEISTLNTSLLNDIDAFKKQCAQHIKELEKKLSYEHKLCKEMKSQCDDAYRMIDDCQNTLFQVECQMETKDQELNELATENDKLAGTLAAVDQEKNELQLLLAEFRNMACEKDCRLHDLARQLDDKHQELFDFENRIKKISEFLEATEFIIKEKDTEIAKLKESVNEFSSNECDVSSLHEEINKYIERNQLVELEKNQVLEQCNELQLKINHMIEDEKLSKNLIQTKEREIMTYREKNSNLEKDLFDVEIHMKACQEDLLRLQCANLEADLNEMTTKYTNLLGHQNNKQKIKHVIDLKALNTNLKEDNEKLTHTIHKQAATIEKMKKDFAESNKMKSPLTVRKQMFCLSTPLGKENVTSPLGKSPKTLAGSPKLNSDRPLTPLRESNR